ncbi:MAG: hypothetical protein JWN71_2687 [Xanthobacteraceae bacterium]|nr:hypothetical protein [Xanthobacteraceae bacterium]
MLRILNLVVIASLVVAAAYVYRIKFESTRQAERVVKLRTEIRRERDVIASLRAEWAKLDNPRRIQGLAQRHLTSLKPVAATQFDTFDRLPERPASLVPLNSGDPIGAIIESIEAPQARKADAITDLLDDNVDMNPETIEPPTGSVPSLERLQ